MTVDFDCGFVRCGFCDDCCDVVLPWACASVPHWWDAEESSDCEKSMGVRWEKRTVCGESFAYHLTVFLPIFNPCSVTVLYEVPLHDLASVLVVGSSLFVLMLSCD
jgi:hypothetical protein